MAALELVSVVIAARDADAYIDRTLDSVRRQTHEALEIIVVDDGSTDRTAEIVRCHAAADPRIRLLQMPATGVAAARNLGILQAQGELIALVDADDLWHPEKTAAHVARFERGTERLVAVWSPPLTIDEDDRIIGEVLPFDRQTMAAVEGWVLLPLLYRFFPGCGSTVTFRRSALIEAGCFETGAASSEDFSLMLRVTESGQIGVVPRPLVGYRQVPQSRSSRSEVNLYEQLRLLAMMRHRLPWLPGWVMRWSFAGRYMTASSRALRNGNRSRGVAYGLAAVVRDPFVVIHPSAVPQTLALLARRDRSTDHCVALFPSDAEPYVEARARSSGWLYKRYASIERRRHQRMLAAETRARESSPAAMPSG